MGLPSNSQNVPQDVWNNISNLSHMVCPKFNSHVYKQKRWAIGERAWVQRGSPVGGCPMFQKNQQWANQYGSFKKRKVVSTPMN
jgi:hypothetical protein